MPYVKRSTRLAVCVALVVGAGRAWFEKGNRQVSYSARYRYWNGRSGATSPPR